MRPQRKAFQLLILLEAAALIAVLLYGILQMRKEGRSGTETTVSEQGSSMQKAAEDQDFGAWRADVGQNLLKEGTDGKSPDGGAGPGLQSGSGNWPGQREETERKEESQTDGEESGNSANMIAFSPEVTEKLASMTLEEKTAQMFLTTPEALTHNEVVNIARSGTKDAIDACPVGGLVYAAANFQGKEQTKALLSGVQDYSMERIGLPLFLGVEEIGGNGYSPLAVENNYPLQASPAVLGAGGEPEAAAEAGTAIAEYMRAEGFNLNLMPVAGLSKEMEAGEEARCYGADAATVSMMLAEQVTACRAGGIATAVGYFPWKGAGGVCPKGLEEWKDSDALALKAAVGAGTDIIVLGNASYEALTGEAGKPCSLTEGAVFCLREELGYTGLIMTDDLTEEAVAKDFSLEEAVVAATKAGADLLYCPDRLEEAVQAVLEAVRSGEIPQERIEEAVGRILTKKLFMAGQRSGEEESVEEERIQP